MTLNSLNDNDELLNLLRDVVTSHLERARRALHTNSSVDSVIRQQGFIESFRRFLSAIEAANKSGK